MSFNQEMRKATRDIHAVSDALVNAKLLFALSADAVWAEGLQIFYEIFRFLEEAVKRHPDGHLGKLFVKDLARTEAFENDLRHYLGATWRETYDVREEVAGYLLHLQKLEGMNPDLLMAYIYHLYLGLLSGGQILTRKRQIKDKIMRRETKEGYEIANFGGRKIFELKKELKENMEIIAGEISEELKTELLRESRNVFEWNNRIIRTVRGADRALFENLLLFLITLLLLYFLYSWLLT